jgi:hypothetical protein
LDIFDGIKKTFETSKLQLQQMIVPYIPQVYEDKVYESTRIMVNL